MLYKDNAVTDEKMEVLIDTLHYSGRSADYISEFVAESLEKILL